MHRPKRSLMQSSALGYLQLQTSDKSATVWHLKGAPDELESEFDKRKLGVKLDWRSRSLSFVANGSARG